MEDKKYSFACVMVRNYNRALDEMLSETFKKTKNQFANSKSQFLIYLAEIGLSVYLKKLNETEGELTHDSLDEIDELKDLFEEFINYSKCENDQARASHKVSNLLSSAILRVLIDIAEGKEIDIDDIENGEYDKIPERFLKILKQGSKG